MQIVRWMMCANKFQSGIIHGRLDLSRGVIEVAGRFHFLVAQCPDLFERAVIVRRQELSNRIELKCQAANVASLCVGLPAWSAEEPQISDAEPALTKSLRE